MRIALRKDDGVARAQMHRLFAIELDVALAFGDQVEDDDALGAGLEHRRRRVRAGRLVTPWRREPGVDENGADHPDDAQRLRQRIHQLSSTSMRSSTGTALVTALGIGEQR
jgi:hypothetical protein